MSDYKLVKVTAKDIPKYLQLGISQNPCVLYGIHEEPFVWICEEGKYNKDYLADNKLNHYYIKGGRGSTIVCASGDIDLGIFGSKEFCNAQLQKILALLSKKLTNSEMYNNDFMYNGKKYGSATMVEFNECVYIGVHISNNIEKELISNICLKRSYKEPEKLITPITEEEIIGLFTE